MIYRRHREAGPLARERERNRAAASAKIKHRCAVAGHSAGVTSVAFRPNGKTLASGSAAWESEIKLWDVESGEVSSTLVWPNKNAGPNLEGVACLVFSPDGKTLVLGAKNMWIIQWDLEKESIIGISGAYDGRAASSLAFSLDGKFLASSDKSDVSSIRLWNMVDVEKRKPGYGDFPSLECAWSSDAESGVVAFSPNGKTLALGQGLRNLKGIIKFWDVIP